MYVRVFICAFCSEPVFACAQHRQVLFEIFMKNYRVRRSVIQTRLSQELGDAVTKADIDRLLKVARAF